MNLRAGAARAYPWKGPQRTLAAHCPRQLQEESQMASSTAPASIDRADPQALLDAARALVPQVIATRDEARRLASKKQNFRPQ